ncbi:MAG TPA: hypothetical protein VGW12_22645 [Pyrinomonadaceae bacterium]|nr:hypothetical protein [Pyrinomonadaceae bacterium]
MKILMAVLTMTLLVVSAARAQTDPQRGIQREGLRGIVPDNVEDVTLDKRRQKLDEVSRMTRWRPTGSTFQASVVVHNQSAKSIKTVFWSVSLVNPESGELIRKYEVTSDKRIKPTERRKLTQRLPIPFVRVVSATGGGGKSSDEIANVVTVITRVEYTDGSFADSP